MDLIFVLALAAGVLAGPILFIQGRKLDRAALTRIERGCGRFFPMLLTVALGSLVTAFRGRDMDLLALLLLVPGGALAVLAAALLPHPWRWWRHIVAAALVVGALNLEPFVLLGREAEVPPPRAGSMLMDDTDILRWRLRRPDAHWGRLAPGPVAPATGRW